MSNKPHLLYVEDDESLSFVTKDNLELNGFEVTYCADGNDALEKAGELNYDLAILDVMLPNVDGFTIAEAIRKRNKDIPILFLTAKSLKEDRIHGLKIGADDYITKPFSIEELVLKVEIFLKRNKIVSSAKQEVYDLGKYVFNYAALSLKCDEVEYERGLTQREADLLHFFCDNRDKILKRSHILETIWGEDDYFLGRSLDVFISRLRKYLKHDKNIVIENIHGVGFRLKAE